MRSIALATLLVLSGCLSAPADEAPVMPATADLDRPGASDDRLQDEADSSAGPADGEDARTPAGLPPIDMDVLNGHRIGVAATPALANGTLQVSMDDGAWTDRVSTVMRADRIIHDGTLVRLPLEGDTHTFKIRPSGIEGGSGTWTVDGIASMAAPVEYQADQPIRIDMDAPGAFLVRLTMDDGRSYEAQGYWAASWTIAGEFAAGVSPDASVAHALRLVGEASQHVTIKTRSTSDSEVGLVGRSLILGVQAGDRVECRSDGGLVALRDGTDHWVDLGPFQGHAVETWLGAVVEACDDPPRANAEPVPYRMRVAVEPALPGS